MLAALQRDKIFAALTEAMNSGALSADKTLGDVISAGRKVGTLGHAVAWDRYVLVVA